MSEPTDNNIRSYPGKLVIYHETGYIEFWPDSPEMTNEYGQPVLLRIALTPTPVPENQALEIVYGRHTQFNWQNRTCALCYKIATWVWGRQFTGDLLFCDEHAKEEYEQIPEDQRNEEPWRRVGGTYEAFWNGDHP